MSMQTVSSGSTGGGAGSKSLSGFAVQMQEQEFWCWAAVSASVAIFYGAVNRTQCEVASGELAPLDCCGVDASGACNRAWYLDRALTRVGHFAGLILSDISFADLVSEMNADRPLGCRIQWAGGFGAHFVGVGGWSRDGTGLEYVEVHDPFYGFVQIAYNDFCSSYRSPGDTWTHTYFTSATPSPVAGGPVADAPLSA
ncbi:papain-like cysteine protease family protein [Bradyrhizobium sp. HKCCYLS2058]|uniref:papain-like cysteine protease family protein n=2 Tax=Nitrobacteraceae TaxID=41294 RepID=UPI003EC11D14